MAGMHGFQDWNKNRPTPNPSEVGQMLMQQQQAPMMEEGAEMPGEEMDPHDAASGAPWPSSAEAALRAAILRAPGMSVGTNPRSPAPMSREQMARLGLSEEEIELLISTGGANA